MYNRTYNNGQGVKVSGAAANNHLFKKYIEEDNIIQFLEKEFPDDFKFNYIKSPQDMEKAVAVFKMYRKFSVSSSKLFDVGSPYIIDKKFTMAVLNALNCQYCDGDTIYNRVIVEVW